jgi:hypothetical protein
VRIENVDVGELEPGERGLRAFDEVFTGDAKVVDLVAWGSMGRVVGSPVDLCVRLVWHDMSTLGPQIRRMKADLCRYDNVVAFPAKMLDCTAHYFLRLTGRIALSAVEKVDAGVVGSFQAGKGVVVANVATVCKPTAERDGRDLQATLTNEAVLHFREVLWGF